MPVVRTYQCPECEGQFKFMHMTRDEPPPAHCDICKAFMGAVEPELAAPAIGGSAIAKSVDQVYSSMEQTMGITNLNDGLRDGDTAGVKRALPNNEITRVAAQVGHEFWQGHSTAGFVADAKKGGVRGGASYLPTKTRIA